MRMILKLLALGFACVVVVLIGFLICERAYVGWFGTRRWAAVEQMLEREGESIDFRTNAPDAVPDEVWNEAAAHYDEQGLAAVILTIATTNFFNRLNVTTKAPAGETWD